MCHFCHGSTAEFPKSKRDLITFAKQHGMFRVFTEDVEIPVADEEKSVEEIQVLGFAEGEIRKHFLARNTLSRAIKDKTVNDILRRVTLPTAAWRILVGSYSATTRGAKLQHMKAFTNRRVKPGSKPIHTCLTYPAVGMIRGASGVCMRYIRRYGSLEYVT